MKGTLLGALLLVAASCGIRATIVAADAEKVDGGAIASKVLDLTTLPSLGDIIPQLQAKRVVYVGETHDFYAHHLNQLAIIRGLHASGGKWAIGLEPFQQPFQEFLDRFVAGDIDVSTLLDRSEYYQRWKYDFRHYLPILEFARENQIPLVALNAPQELVDRVSQVGLDGLSSEERRQLPADIDRSDTAYHERLRDIYANHPGADDSDFERFLDVQLLWDETMAERIAEYLSHDPVNRIVVLAGNGHLAYGSGIPNRVARRTPTDSAIVINDIGEKFNAEVADFVLLPESQELPPKGRLGIYMQPADGGVRIESFTENSAAKVAGARAGDFIIALDSRPVRKIADIRLAMWDKLPGESILLRVRRPRWLVATKEVVLEVSLD